MHNLSKRLAYVIVAVMIAAALGGYAFAQGDAAATPEPTVAPPAESESVATGGYLGIYYDIADAGVLVTNVEKDSPAESAGLQAGDVISAVNGAAVTGENISDVIASYTVGDVLTLAVMRGDEALELAVTLGARPESLTMMPMLSQFDRPMLGVTLEESDAGPRITEVLEGSPAAEIGLQVGDIIKTVNGVTVATVEEAVNAVRNHNTSTELTATVERDGETLEFSAVLRGMMRAFGRVPEGMHRFGMSSDGLFRSMVEGASFDYIADEEAWEVTEIEETSALYEAGLRLGDKITALEGQKPTLGAFQMGRDFRFGSDETVTLTVLRGEETLDIEAPSVIVPALLVNSMFEMRGIPDPELFEFQIVPPMQGREGRGGRIVPQTPFGQTLGVRLGVAFIMLDEQSAADYGVTVAEGALITAVETVSPANNAGVQINDVVVSVDGEALSVQRTLRDVIAQKSPGDVIVLTVIRGEETLEISVTLGQPEQFSNTRLTPVNNPFAESLSL